MAIEIVDFPIENGGSFHSYFDITRGYPSIDPNQFSRSGKTRLGTLPDVTDVPTLLQGFQGDATFAAVEMQQFPSQPGEKCRKCQ